MPSRLTSQREAITCQRDTGDESWSPSGNHDFEILRRDRVSGIDRLLHLLCYLGDRVGHEAVRLAMHGDGGLLVGRVDQAEHLAGCFVEPVSDELAHTACGESPVTRHGQIATVADRVGYEPEAAFSRAFKKVAGMPLASGGGAAVIDTARSGRGLCYWPPASPSRNAEGRYSCETLTR